MEIDARFSREGTSNSVINGALGFMGLGLVMATLGAYLLSMIVPGVISPTVALIVGLVLQLVFIFTSGMWSQKPGLNVVMYCLFTLLGGITLYPILTMALASSVAMTAAIQALLTSAGLFIVMAVIGYTTKRDLSKLGTILMSALIVLIIVSVINIFFFSSWVSLVISGISVVVFSLFTMYDIKNIKDGAYPNAVMAGIALYLDFINLFVSLFNIFMAFAGGNDN